MHFACRARPAYVYVCHSVALGVISATNEFVWSYFAGTYHFTSIEYTPALPKTFSFGKNNALLTSIDVKWSQKPSFTSSLAVVVYLKRHGMVYTAAQLTTIDMEWYARLHMRPRALPQSTWNDTRPHAQPRTPTTNAPAWYLLFVIISQQKTGQRKYAL